MAFKGDMFIWKDRKRYLGLPLSVTRYALSEDRLFMSVGFFSIRDEEILLYRIRDISVKRTLWQRLFGVGTVTVRSSDKSTPEIFLKSIRNPLSFNELLHSNVEECKLKRRIRIGEMSADLRSDDSDLDDDIPELEEN